MRAFRKPKRTATAIPEEGQWLPHPETGRWYRYYYDESGQKQIEWYEAEAPRTEGVDDGLYGDAASENDPGSGGYYTHTASQGVETGYAEDFIGAAGGYTEEPTEVEDLAAGFGSLTVDDDEGEQVQHPSRHAKGKSNERKSSKRDDKTPSSSKPKKEGKGGGDKKPKGKGKEKETHPQEGPPEDPFYSPDQPHQAHKQQPRAHHKKRTPAHGHGHQSAPTGVTGGATPEGTTPVDPGYGARSAPTMDAEAAYYPPDDQSVGGTHGEWRDPDDQIELPNELGDIGVPTDAGYSSVYPPQEVDDNDDEFQRAIAASRQGAFGGTAAGYDAYPPGYGQAESSYAREADYEPVLDEDDDGTITPTKDNPGLAVDQVIRGTGGSYEVIDNRYRVEPSTKFQPGEVFKILWSEPQGQKKLDIEKTYTDRLQLQNDWGEPFYVGFRRFIVVANDEGHCTCVPILTYIRQGCKKKGVKPAKHGIVHEYGTKPRMLEGEPQLGFRPIRLQIHATGERLARESRVNYSKLVTVEHNVKVFFIGNIFAQDFDDVVHAAVDKCWTDKIRKRMKKGQGKDSRH